MCLRQHNVSFGCPVYSHNGFGGSVGPVGFQHMREVSHCIISLQRDCTRCVIVPTLSPRICLCPPKIAFHCCTFGSKRLILKTLDVREKFESHFLGREEGRWGGRRGEGGSLPGCCSFYRRCFCFLQDNPGSSLAQRHPIPISPKASAIVSSTLWWQICGAVRIAG